jgi:hypothetical protein
VAFSKSQLIVVGVFWGAVLRLASQVLYHLSHSASPYDSSVLIVKVPLSESYKKVPTPVNSCKFEASLGYIEGPCFKKETNQKTLIIPGTTLWSISYSPNICMELKTIFIVI